MQLGNKVVVTISVACVVGVGVTVITNVEQGGGVVTPDDALKGTGAGMTPGTENTRIHWLQFDGQAGADSEGFAGLSLTPFD